MEGRKYLAAIAFLLSAPCSVATPQGAASPETAVRAIYGAIAHADTIALGRWLSTDLRWVSGNSGSVATRQQLLNAASRAIPEIRLEYEVDSVETRKTGSVATVDYLLTNRRTFRDYQTIFTSRVTDTFAREGGSWRLLRHIQAWTVHSPDTTSLDSLHLAAFVGRYDRGHGYIDDVHFHDGHLVAQSTYEALMGAPGARLYPVSANAFSPERSAPMIVFERDDRGRVTGYVQQQPDGPITRAPRLSITETPSNTR